MVGYQARPQHQVKEGYRSLHGTSQGRIFDLPPEHWIPQELIKFGVRRATGKANLPSLTEPLHPVFARNLWYNIGDTRYEALRPSMALASKLLRLSSASFASFFPKFRQNKKRARRASAPPLNDNTPISREDAVRMEQAQALFDIIAPTKVRWAEDDQMFSKRHWVGINAPSNADPPFEVADEWAWAEADDDEEAYAGNRRSVTIGIASEFADMILKSERDSDGYLFATFYAGITMVHELGHWCTTIRTDAPSPAHGEPFYGDAIEMEMGNSYISWLFGGFRPDWIQLESTNYGFENLTNGLCWLRTLNFGDSEPMWETRYSMKIKHIERIMSEKAWAPFKDLIGTDNGLVRRLMLAPRRFHVFDTARTAKACGRAFGSNDRDSYSRFGQSNHIDLRVAPFNYVDLYWSERRKKGDATQKTQQEAVTDCLSDIKKYSVALDQLKRDQAAIDDRHDLASSDATRAATELEAEHESMRKNPVKQKGQTTQFEARRLSKLSEQASKVNDVRKSREDNDARQLKAYKNLLDAVKRLGEASGRHAGSKSSSSGSRASSDKQTSTSHDKRIVGIGILHRAPLLASLSQPLQSLIAQLKDMRSNPQNYPDLRDERYKSDDDPEDSDNERAGQRTRFDLNIDEEEGGTAAFTYPVVRPQAITAQQRTFVDLTLDDNDNDDDNDLAIISRPALFPRPPPNRPTGTGAGSGSGGRSGVTPMTDIFAGNDHHPLLHNMNRYNFGSSHAPMLGTSGSGRRTPAFPPAGKSSPKAKVEPHTESDDDDDLSVLDAWPATGSKRAASDSLEQAAAKKRSSKAGKAKSPKKASFADEDDDDDDDDDEVVEVSPPKTAGRTTRGQTKATRSRACRRGKGN